MGVYRKYCVTNKAIITVYPILTLTKPRIRDIHRFWDSFIQVH